MNNNNKIEFPNPPVYYIVMLDLNQTTPTTYGFLKSDEVLAADVNIENIKQFTNFESWKLELATYGIVVELDNNGNWF
jgi:hypothetical protein